MRPHVELRFPVSARRAYSPGPPHGLCQRGELGALAHSWMTRVLKEKENEAPKREKPNPWDLGKSWKGGGTRGLAVRLQVSHTVTRTPRAENSHQLGPSAPAESEQGAKPAHPQGTGAPPPVLTVSVEGHTADTTR